MSHHKVADAPLSQENRKGSVSKSPENSVNHGHQTPHSNHHHKHNAHHGYNPIQMPPDWNFAQKHARARLTRPEKQQPEYKELNEDGQQNGQPANEDVQICECCGYEIDREEIDYTCNLDKLYFLGAGFPMFYNFIQYCILLLTTLFLVEGLPNAVNNYGGNHCSLTEQQVARKEKQREEKQQEAKQHGKQLKPEIRPCAYNWVVIFSIANKLNDPSCLSLKVYFALAVQICLIIQLVYFRKTQRDINETVDSDQTTPSDYSIWVKNIPKTLESGYQKAIKAKIQTESVPDKQVSVERVFLIYDIHELEEKEHELQHILNEKAEYIDKIYNHTTEKQQFDANDPKILEFDERIEKQEEEIDQHCKHVRVHPKQYFTGSAIVSLTTEQDQKLVLEHNQMGSSENWNRLKAYFDGGASTRHPKPHLYWQDRHLYVEQAPEPNDFNWEFLHQSTPDKIKARTKSFMQQTALQLLCTGTIYGISAAQSYLIDTAHEELMNGVPGAEQQYGTIKILSIILSIIIVIFNKFGLGILVHHIADGELWSTQTKLNISFAKMLSLILFSNTALITFLVEIITFKNYYGAGGMIFTEYIVFIFNAFIPPLAWLVDPWSIIKNYQRNKEQAQNVSNLTQERANIVMEQTGYTMGKRYADIMKTMWFTFFYCPVIPLGSFWSIIGLICYYWIDKYNLIHRRTIKQSISKELTFEMIESLELIIVFHAIGDFFFKYQLFQYVDKASVIVLGFGVLYNLLPLQRFNEWLFPIESDDETTTYNQAKLDFDTDYDRENPITKHSALKEWLSLRQQKSDGKDDDEQKSAISHHSLNKNAEDKVLHAIQGEHH